MLIIVSNNYVMNTTTHNADINMDSSQFRKMLFLYNAIQDGWTVKKKDNSYIFQKNHENKREVFLDTYLTTFMKSNLDVSQLLTPDTQ